MCIRDRDQARLDDLFKKYNASFFETRVLANTAKELIDHDHEKAIHSPRRVGAGLINIYDAITTKVTVSDVYKRQV